MSPFCFSWPPNGSIVNKWSRIVKTTQGCFSKWIEIKVTWVKFWKFRVKLGTISFLHLVTLSTKSKAFCQLNTVHGKWELLNLDLFSNLNIDHKLQIHWMPLICFFLPSNGSIVNKWSRIVKGVPKHFRKWTKLLATGLQT
jgi:hypothetical protein